MRLTRKERTSYHNRLVFRDLHNDGTASEGVTLQHREKLHRSLD